MGQGRCHRGRGPSGNIKAHRAPDLVQWTRHVEVRDHRGTRELPHVKRKVFISRKSLLDELMEVQHFRTIYHMFIAGLCVLIISTLAIDLIDEGRLMLEFDLLIFSFGQLPLALMTWVPMFLSTLLVPYQTLRLWARPSTGGTWMLGAGLGCALLAAHGAMLCILPVHVAVKHQLPPASKCVLVFEQALGCVLYACFILARLCVPVFANMSREPFSTRALLLSILHATGPGIFMLLLIFFAFLHCWLNAFAEMLRFGDRMFYRLLGMRARKVAMLGVFLVSAVVHEYIFCFVLGFFYPVMLMQFLVVGGLLNFTMNDRHTGPAWNVLMWTLLFLGQGIQVSLYCQEWYARRHCPLPQKSRHHNVQMMVSALLYLQHPGLGSFTALPYPIQSQGLAHTGL
ncbi:sterol O-acyltransferase 2 [Cricetulus griseus]